LLGGGFKIGPFDTIAVWAYISLSVSGKSVNEKVAYDEY
jgi:hypothetical protein